MLSIIGYFALQSWIELTQQALGFPPNFVFCTQNQIPQHWNGPLMGIRVIMQVPIGGSPKKKNKNKNQRISSNNVQPRFLQN
jgi:hypothetical protein